MRRTVMATTKQKAPSVDESTLEMITSIQERIVDAHKEFASTVAKLVPELPNMPRTEMFDTPDTKSLVEQSFDFQSRLLEANRAFSLGLIDAWSEVVPKETSTK
jgi:hypothetical protein